MKRVFLMVISLLDVYKRQGVYDIRELLDSSVKLMDGKSPLDIQLPGPLNALKKPLLHVIHGTVVEKVLQDHDIIR